MEVTVLQLNYCVQHYTQVLHTLRKVTASINSRVDGFCTLCDRGTHIMQKDRIMRKRKTNNRIKRKLHFVFMQMPINKKDESTSAISVLKLESISVVSKSSSISPSSCNNITTICLAEQSSECTEQVYGVTLEIGTHFNHAFRKSPLRDYRFTKIRYLNKAVRLALIAKTGLVEENQYGEF